MSDEPLPSHYHRCFGCGPDHPTGMHMEMYAGEGLSVHGSFLVTEHHQGAPGLAHGGVIAAAVDEAMGFLLWLIAHPAVTAHLEVDYRKPVPVGARLELEGEAFLVEERKIHARMTGRINGEVAVDAKALFLKVNVEHFQPHAERFGGEVGKMRTYNP
ncbi:MAG: PaaI family thioesterase [Actinomycetota bacterium]|nr:PaaI family thioesterase [Actinomycetota bacterium]